MIFTDKLQTQESIVKPFWPANKGTQIRNLQPDPSQMKRSACALVHSRKFSKIRLRRWNMLKSSLYFATVLASWLEGGWGKLISGKSQQIATCGTEGGVTQQLWHHAHFAWCRKWLRPPRGRPRWSNHCRLRWVGLWLTEKCFPEPDSPRVYSLPVRAFKFTLKKETCLHHQLH